MTLEEACKKILNGDYDSSKIWMVECEEALRSYALSQITEAFGRVEVEDDTSPRFPGGAKEYFVKGWNESNDKWRYRIAEVLEAKKRELH